MTAGVPAAVHRLEAARAEQRVVDPAEVPEAAQVEVLAAAQEEAAAAR